MSGSSPAALIASLLRINCPQYGARMPTFDDVAKMAAALPEVTEGNSRGNRSWSAGGKAFA